MLTQGDDMSTAREMIATANLKFGEHVAKRDFSSLAAGYTEDAELLPPGSPVVKGRAAIGPFWQSTSDALGLKSAVLTTRELTVSGDTAHEIGDAVLTMTAGSMPVKYLVIWKLQPCGAWKMHRDIWN
jgi:ketosteroid isomerase-like protein